MNPGAPNAVKCFLCDRDDPVPRFRLGQQELVQCRSCGLVYADSVPSAAIYETDDYFVKRNEYVQRWDEFCAIFGAILDKVRRYKDKGILLDVGTSVGALLHVARERGYVTCGVEVSEWASAYARDERKLDVVTGTLEDAAFPDLHFDVVVINHVLEHVPDPLSLLREARRILKDDGVVVVGVPNFGSIMAAVLRERWPSLCPGEHLWHFAPSTLRRALGRAGFRVVHFEARDNHAASGWRPTVWARRVINLVSALTNRSEAMLVIAMKQVH